MKADMQKLMRMVEQLQIGQMKADDNLEWIKRQAVLQQGCQNSN